MDDKTKNKKNEEEVSLDEMMAASVSDSSEPKAESVEENQDEAEKTRSQTPERSDGGLAEERDDESKESTETSSPESSDSRDDEKLSSDREEEEADQTPEETNGSEKDCISGRSIASTVPGRAI